MSNEKLLGAVGMSSLTIRPGDTSVASGISDLPVVATSALINLAESACTAALVEFFEPGETSHTVTSQLNYLSGVSIGATIRAHATCIDVAGHQLTFNVEINHEGKLIASGTILRKIVDRVSYMARMAAEGMLVEKKIT